MTAGNSETVPEGAFCRPWRTAGWSLWIVALTTGCSAPGKPLVECPLSDGQQQQAVLAIVPPGTPRGLAEQRLTAAGIKYSQGGSGSLYYLSLWNRADGERWHINVALLFDQSGKVYQARPADSTMSLARDTSAGEPESATDAADAPSGFLHEDGELEMSGGRPARVAFPAQGRPSPVGAP